MKCVACHSVGPALRRRTLSRSGFSFVEVLFAVMILGIGFIMLAGIFPVALSQTQSAADDSTGAAVARGAIEYLSSLRGTQAYMTPAPNNAMRMISYAEADASGGQLATLVSGNQILPEDTRYGWVAYYRRLLDTNGNPSQSAQVVVIACRARAKPSYEPGDVLGDKNTVRSLTPRKIAVTLNPSSNADAPDSVVVSDSTGLASGTFVVIETDTTHNCAGWILRLGNPISADGKQWELLPGNDFKATGVNRPGAGTSASGFVVGQGIDPTGGFSGPAQDIAAYTSYIPVK